MEFPALHIHQPQGSHTHTVILLHGRSSNGPEFAEELFSSTPTFNGKSLTSCLPTYRWVFPTSHDRWSTTFQEEICSWFDAYSLSDIQERQELQKDGLRESILQILDILESEARLLGGNLSRIYLGGISQGMATALWAFFAAVGRGEIQGPLAGLWASVDGYLSHSNWTIRYVAQQQSLINSLEISQEKESVDVSVLSTPVFLCHGADDAWVSVDLGRQASRVLRKIMIHVEWLEFIGAENDGHWIAEPEGFGHIFRFLDRPNSANGTGNLPANN